ncbi:MAG: hypothetical protein EBS56_02930 [Planctomycetia bacterium]|nr:hypothetical protein [Planctomycetia bacterium]
MKYTRPSVCQRVPSYRNSAVAARTFATASTSSMPPPSTASKLTSIATSALSPPDRRSRA